MNNLLQTTGIVVASDPVLDEGRGPQMEIEGYQGFMAYVRHFPVVWEKLSASIGSVSIGGGSGSLELREWLSFSNSQEVSTQYPISTVKSWGVYGSVEDKEGNGLPSNIFKLDIKNSLITSKYSCYADLEIEYTSQYVVLKYLPQITGNTMRYGVIRSRLNNQVAQFRVPPPVLATSKIELCRVVSYYIISELNGVRGSYEMPDNFPSNLGYPVIPHTLEEEGSLKVERVHEIVHVDKSLFTTSDLFFAQRLKPYDNNGTYKPKFFFKKNTSPGDDWESVFAKVKWAPLFTGLADKYPELTEE